jgi:hypothetical protein
MAIQHSFRFSNDYGKIVAENVLVIGWQVQAVMGHLKTRLAQFSDVYCTLSLRQTRDSTFA